MKTEPSRVSFTALATFVFLAFAVDPTPSQPSISTASRTSPDPAQLALADWAAGRTGGSLSAMRPADLQAALGTKRHGYELFPQAADRSSGLLEERRFLTRLPYGRAMWRAALRNRLDGLLIAAVVETESAFSPTAVSPDGAIGLMQVIPENGDLHSRADLFDPNINLDVGSQYLSGLIERYHGDLRLAVAAYNAGPGAVTRYGGVPPFRETRDYVKTVLSLYVDHRQNIWKTSAGSRRGDDLTTPMVAAAHELFRPAPQSTLASAAR